MIINDRYKEILTFFDQDDIGNLIVFSLQGSAGDVFMSTALLPSVHELFPDLHIYFNTKPEYFDILKNNPYIYKVIPYIPELEDNFIIFEGVSQINGVCRVVYTPGIIAQRVPNYQHNGLKAHNLDFKDASN